MKKSCLSFWLILLSVMTLAAQEISFEKSVHDFGNVREGGKVTAPFVLKNTGDAPLIIRRVSVTCGCTTPSYPKTPIAPGDTAVIDVAYSTDGRPGNFNKNVTVYSNALSQPAYTLTIRGSVEGRQNTPGSVYPKEIGPLRLRSNQLFLGEVILGSLRTETISVFNQNEDLPIRISFHSVPKHIRVSASNTLLPAGETAIITVNYVASDIKDYGRREDFFYVTVEGSQKFSGKIRVNAFLKEDFSKKKNSTKKPLASYSGTVVNLGRIKKGRVAEAELVLSNKGNETLHIRKIDCPASQLMVKPDKNSVSAGKSTRLKISLDSSKLRADVKYYIDVITNDPVNTIHRITVNATIVE